MVLNNLLDVDLDDSAWFYKGLEYENRGHKEIIAYTDVDWVGSPCDRRSTSGCYVLSKEISFHGKVRNKM